MSLRDQLQRLYAELPSVECQGKCFEFCGPVACSTGERHIVRNAEPGRVLELGSMNNCPMLDLDTKRCQVYVDRPLVCRLFGMVEAMRCPHGCEPTRWLTDAEVQEFKRRIHRLSKAAGLSDAIVTLAPKRGSSR